MLSSTKRSPTGPCWPTGLPKQLIFTGRPSVPQLGRWLSPPPSRRSLSYSLCELWLNICAQVTSHHNMLSQLCTSSTFKLGDNKDKENLVGWSLVYFRNQVFFNCDQGNWDPELNLHTIHQHSGVFGHHKLRVDATGITRCRHSSQLTLAINWNWNSWLRSSHSIICA